MKKAFYFNIDVFGACNLKCPSCPSGNSSGKINPRGAMTPEMLRKVLDKAQAECEVTGVALFNWNEPVLHPKLPELIRIVKARGLNCAISTNMNHFPNMDAVLEANPEVLRISNSGFTQENYGRTHRDGDIERVKQNMQALAKAKKRAGATTLINVLYHRYKQNLEEEQAMREFATGLGFVFRPVWAVMMPLEKTIPYVMDRPAEGGITAEDEALIDSLALPLKEAAAITRKHAAKPCPLRDDQVTMDWTGRVQLCCAVFDTNKYSLGSYLDTPLEKLQAAKNEHPLCGPCMDNGMHVYATYGTDELDLLAEKTVGEKSAAMLGLRAERIRKLAFRPVRVIGRKVYRLVMGKELR